MRQVAAVVRQPWAAHALVGVAAVVVSRAASPGALREVLFTAVAAWAALGVLWASRSHAGSIAVGLRVVGIGLIAVAAGDAVFAAYEFVDRPMPFPSPADAVYLLGYVLLSGGLLLVGSRHLSRDSLIDACVVTAGVTGVVWLSVVAPLLEPGWSTATAVAVAYPLGSVLLLIAASQLWLGVGGRSTSIRLLSLGLLAWLATDAVYAHQVLDDTYEAGALIDVGWLAAYVLVAAGVMHPSLRLVAERRRDGAMVTPHRFALLAVSSASIPAATALFDLEPVPPLMALTVIGIVLSAIRLVRPVRALRHHALRDSLTDLPNRHAFTEQLVETLEGLHADEEVALLFCDLDHFKVVNDSLGHPAGDLLLREIALRLRACLRADDVVARLGGDEFVVLVAPTRDAAVAADRLAQRILTEVATPVVLGSGHRVTPSLSIGIRTTDGRDADPALLLSDADAAMYSAKTQGRSGAARFDPQMRQEALDRLVVDAELRDALEHGQLTCVYQPELDLQTGALFGLECLVRWEHPVHGTLLPARFIPHAEAHGLMGPVFSFVLDHALSSQQRWTKVLGVRPAVAVNVSPVQRLEGDLATTVLTALARHAAPAGSLWLEVTESALVDEQLTDALGSLRSSGVRVAVDDFGTGWSSLGRLASAQWDALKIDRSFVGRLEDPSSEMSQVVAATVAMAHALGMLTIAEGVETAEEAARLRSFGCDIAQGHLIARPVGADEVVQLLQRLERAGSAVLGQHR
jgi:diguanylate cyclase